MNEETKMRQLYEDMYVAMAAKDEAEDVAKTFE